MKGVILGMTEVVAERPFTHPQLADVDRQNMAYMAEFVCLQLAHPTTGRRPATITMRRDGAEHWFHRVILVSPDRLRRARRLSVVGFFGECAGEGDPEGIAEFDAILVNSLASHPGLLGYSSMALASGDYGNLVLFSSDKANARWSQSEAHVAAAQRIAPRHYRTVRIVRGRLPNGILDPYHLILAKAKYFDYQSQPAWRAERQLEER